MDSPFLIGDPVMAINALLGDALKLIGLILIAIGITAYVSPYIPVHNMENNSNYIPRNLPPTETTITKTKTIEITKTTTQSTTMPVNEKETGTTIYTCITSQTSPTHENMRTTYFQKAKNESCIKNEITPIIMNPYEYSNISYIVDLLNHEILLNKSCSQKMTDNYEWCYNPLFWLGSSCIPGEGQIYVLAYEPGMLEIYINGSVHGVFSKVLCEQNSTATPNPWGNTTVPISQLLNQTWILEINGKSVPLIFNWTPKPSTIMLNISYKKLLMELNGTYHEPFYERNKRYCAIIWPNYIDNNIEFDINIGGIPDALYNVELNITTPDGSTFYPNSYELYGSYDRIQLPENIISPGLTISIELTDIKLHLIINIT